MNLKGFKTKKKNVNKIVHPLYSWGMLLNYSLIIMQLLMCGLLSEINLTLKAAQFVGLVNQVSCRKGSDFLLSNDNNTFLFAFVHMLMKFKKINNISVCTQLSLELK